MISLCHPHFLFWTETSSTFTFDSPAALLWHFLSCPATEWGCSTAGHISPSPLPPALNQGPPILSLPLCTTLTLSPPSFSLAVSPVALRTESSTADAFSPTCPYLQKKARRGTYSLWIWLPPPQCLLWLALCWWCWFPYGMTTAPAALHHLSFLTRAPWECSLVGWMDF